jgi:hypothetical protein
VGVRQLEEFLGQADQKGFWIFSYANLGGGFFGAFAANSLLERTAPALKLLGILLGILLGVAVTWKVKGCPVYRWIVYCALFFLRRHLKVGLGEGVIDAVPFYRSHAVKREPFMVVSTRYGRPVPVLVHRGSSVGAGAGAPAGFLDSLPVVSLDNAGAAREAASLYASAPTLIPRPAPKSALALARGSIGDVVPERDYGEWDL